MISRINYREKVREDLNNSQWAKDFLQYRDERFFEALNIPRNAISILEGSDPLGGYLKKRYEDGQQ